MSGNMEAPPINVRLHQYGNLDFEKLTTLRYWWITQYEKHEGEYSEKRENVLQDSKIRQENHI